MGYIHRITAFDPGGTTGVAIRMVDGSVRTRAETDPEVVFDLVVCSEYVVYEDFQTAFRIDKNGLHTVRIIGGIIALCYEHDISIFKHSPFKRKAFQEQAHQMLKGQRHMIHEEDALAHLLAYEYSNS